MVCVFIVGSQYRVVDCLLRLGVIKGNGTRDNPDPRPRIWGVTELVSQLSVINLRDDVTLR